MNFEQVKSFISVAETGNFSTSARQRFLSQPTISNQIRQLEEELGIRLFIRNSQKVVLTDAGANFYRYANRLLAVENDIYMNISEKKEQHYGLFSIGAPRFQAEKQMNPFLRCVCMKYGSRMCCKVTERKDRNIPDLILDGELELGICNTVVKDARLKYEYAFTERFVLVTPNKEEYQNLKQEQQQELIWGQRHIGCEYSLGDDILYDNLYEHYIGNIIHSGKMYARCANLHMQEEAIEAGLGVGFMPNTFVQGFCDEGKVLAYPCTGLMERELYAVYDIERAKSTEIILRVKDLLVEELRKVQISKE